MVIHFAKIKRDSLSTIRASVLIWLNRYHSLKFSQLLSLLKSLFLSQFINNFNIRTGLLERDIFYWQKFYYFIVQFLVMLFMFFVWKLIIKFYNDLIISVSLKLESLWKPENDTFQKVEPTYYMMIQIKGRKFFFLLFVSYSRWAQLFEMCRFQVFAGFRVLVRPKL